MLDDAWAVRLLRSPHHQDDSLPAMNTRRDVGLPLPPSGARNLLGNSGKMALSQPGDEAAGAVGVAVGVAVPSGVISKWFRGGGEGEGLLNNKPANDRVENWRRRM